MACDTILIVSQEAFLCRHYRYCLLYSPQHSWGISVFINEVIGFPNNTSIEGGYDIICTLVIDSGCYHIEHDRLYSATGALYRFSKELNICYTELYGTAEYHLLSLIEIFNAKNCLLLPLQSCI